MVVAVAAALVGEVPNPPVTKVVASAYTVAVEVAAKVAATGAPLL